MAYQIEKGVHAFPVEDGEVLVQIRYYYHPDEGASVDCPASYPFVEPVGDEWGYLSDDEREIAIEEIMGGA
jgi:hypothetical protein